MSSDNKINVFFNEYNLLMGSGGVMYLPFVSGILSANAKKINKIKQNFIFQNRFFRTLMIVFTTKKNLILPLSLFQCGMSNCP